MKESSLYYLIIIVYNPIGNKNSWKENGQTQLIHSINKKKFSMIVVLVVMWLLLFMFLEFQCLAYNKSIISIDTNLYFLN